MHTDDYQFHRFIRNKVTGQFLSRNGSWTANLAEAAEFSDALTMLDYCHAHSLVRGIQVLLKPHASNAQEVVADLF